MFLFLMENIFKQHIISYNKIVKEWLNPVGKKCYLIVV